MTRYDRGAVVLVPFPFTDFSTAKQRPAVVISPNRLNANRDDVVLLAITSQVPTIPVEDEFLLAAEDLTGTGLLKPSVVKLAKIITIHQDLVRRQIGRLSSPQLARVLQAWQRLFAAT